MNRSKTKKRFSKRINNKKIKKQSSRHKYSNKKKTFNKIKGGMFRRPVDSDSPPSYSESLSLEVLPVKMKQKLKPIVSLVFPESICDKSVKKIENGNILFRDLVLFLDKNPKFYPDGTNPKDYEDFSPEEKRKYIEFYNNEENKEWLGCQIYLFLTIKDISSTGYATFDDGNYFFKWLTHRLKDGDPKFFIEDPPFK